MYSSQKVDGVDSGPGLQSSGGWEELKALNGIHRVSILWTTLCRGQVAQNVLGGVEYRSERTQIFAKCLET